MDELRADTGSPDRDVAEHPVMGLLHAGVPLSLLVDLSTLPTPGAAEILAQEGRPERRWWEQRHTG